MDNPPRRTHPRRARDLCASGGDGECPGCGERHRRAEPCPSPWLVSPTTRPGERFIFRFVESQRDGTIASSFTVGRPCGGPEGTGPIDPDHGDFYTLLTFSFGGQPSSPSAPAIRQLPKLEFGPSSLIALGLNRLARRRPRGGDRCVRDSNASPSVAISCPRRRLSRKPTSTHIRRGGIRLDRRRGRRSRSGSGRRAVSLASASLQGECVSLWLRGLSYWVSSPYERGRSLGHGLRLDWWRSWPNRA